MILITKPDCEFEAIEWHQKQLSKNNMTLKKTYQFSIEFYNDGNSFVMFHSFTRKFIWRISTTRLQEKNVSYVENSESDGKKKGKGKPDVVLLAVTHQAFVQNFQRENVM